MSYVTSAGTTVLLRLSCVPLPPSPSSSYIYLYSVDVLAQGIKVSFHLLLSVLRGAQALDSIHPFRTHIVVLHSLGMEHPLLCAEDKLDQAKEVDLPTSRCHRPLTTDIGEVVRSDQTQGGSSVEEPC